MPDNNRFASPSPRDGQHANDRKNAAGTPSILNVPGLNNSCAEHWQSRWEWQYPWFHRVNLGMWSGPDRNIWVQRLDQAIRAAGQPVILVAHSLGCLAVAWWAALGLVVAALDRIRFGDIRLTIYEGRLVQVDVTERTRLPQGC